MRIFQEVESQVRSYIRTFPTVFTTAKGSYMWDEKGNQYIDFFAGAGTLNYGHNNPKITEAMIQYLQGNGIVHGLDQATIAKKEFIEKFFHSILEPRELNYKLQFTGPTGTNAVEAALKLARKVKQRSNIIAFTHAFHGMTMGSLSITGNSSYRDQSYGALNNRDFLPYDGYLGSDINTIDYLHRFIEDRSSGIDLPAAIIVETVQGEGGINVASNEWLRGLEKICREFDIFLIVDDIQMGNGRTGTFFSFERAGIKPDMVTLSKSLGGGLPMALLLMRPEIDQWQPGEHSGTFRGNNLAFVAATKALEYWNNNNFAGGIKRKGKIIESELGSLVRKYSELIADVRGVGMVWGLEISEPAMARKISRKAFEKGLVIELSGAYSEVVKLMPSLTIEEETLRNGLAIMEEAIAEVLEAKSAALVGASK